MRNSFKDCIGVALLGSAWPTMYQEFGVPVSYAGIITFIIAMRTVFSSLMSDRLTKKLGTGKVTAISVVLFPIYLMGILMVMTVMHESLCHKCEH